MVTLSHQSQLDGISHKTDHKTWKNLVEDSRTDDVIQHRHHMVV